ncbi:MAG: hypothetical protein J5626_09845 [Lachnospiraceae bacterium]|nr:hypothetical protein [Lachnospiraceae bacterium]
MNLVTKKSIGWVLVIIGLFMLFKMVRVYSFGFYRIGRMSTSAIVLVLLVLSAIAVVVKRNAITVGCLILSLILLVLSLILGTQLYFTSVSLTDVLLVFIPTIVGTGLLIRSAFEGKKKKGTED